MRINEVKEMEMTMAVACSTAPGLAHGPSDALTILPRPASSCSVTWPCLRRWDGNTCPTSTSSTWRRSARTGGSRPQKCQAGKTASWAWAAMCNMVSDGRLVPLFFLMGQTFVCKFNHLRDVFMCGVSCIVSFESTA